MVPFSRCIGGSHCRVAVPELEMGGVLMFKSFCEDQLPAASPALTPNQYDVSGATVLSEYVNISALTFLRSVPSRYTL